ncbi:MULTISPECIES: DUF2076 domain-containing protein [unclassified Rhizobium]|uniref:DUF2076 domain-containing protein n=1 Tax=unclassified Rhizobium TaxID=2613769 RepID=UPI000DD8FFD8|nr:MULTISPECIES: DUF2076 domain-containing protein [unclassified Rhizobium]MBB3381648.1 hypothetical protein [Rhizobium sp. BK098]MBB3566902.1 hypothetical protein [Rhizobium sp. BK491]MBB3613350.1 hypothetical protein [Rhizobium sp. BK609]MBB3679008.1 hypothetical protein [Rhizobium sp. BK612]
MSPEERQLLASLFDRVRGAASTQRDADAEAFINQSVRDQPYAPYFLAQAVIMQEQGMKAAADRIQQLEARVHELEQQGADNHPQGQSGGFLGGIGSLFGGGQQQRAAAPQGSNPQQQGRLYDDYARNAPQPGPWTGQPQPQPSGPWSQQASAPSAGGSFLRGALGTAAGVAGGVMLAESLSSLFSPHLGGTGGGLFGGNAGSGLFGGTAANAAEQPVQETIINNNYFGNDDNSDQNDQSAADYAQDAAQDAQDDDYDDSSYDNGDDNSFA